MAQKGHIRKSLYNEGKLAIEHILPNDFALAQLAHQRNRLRHSLDNLLLQEEIAHTPLHSFSKYFIPQTTVETFASEWTPGCVMTLEQSLNKVTEPYFNCECFCINNYAFCSYGGFSQYHPNDRIASINEDIRVLKLELKRDFSTELLNEIRSLVKELYSIISFFFNKQKKHVKRLRVSLCGSLIRDIRKTYRQTIQFIFKNLPDFSGCDDEAELTSTENFKPLFLIKQNNHVQYRIFT